MKAHRLLPFLVGVTLAAASLPAAAALKVIEQAIETSTFAISLPDSGSGSVAVKACAQCKPMLLRFTPRSRFLVSGAQVPYSEFVALARGSGEQGLDIFYDRKTGTITRLRMNGVHRIAPRRPARPT